MLARFALPDGYPEAAPPTLTLQGASLTRAQSRAIAALAVEACGWSEGECVIFRTVEWLKDHFACAAASPPCEDFISTADVTESSSGTRSVAIPRIVHGESIVDRKSVFQAHVAEASAAASCAALCDHRAFRSTRAKRFRW